MPAETRQFGKYQLVEILGEGGMARVYRAVRAGPMGFRKEVALKQILPQVAREEKLIRALINEARLGGYLRHRNVVEVYEFDQVDDTFYIAMEFVRGHTLEDVLQLTPRRGLLPPRIVAQIALQICAGLDYAHGAVDEDDKPMNLVHRDLKPTNVMLERDGVVKIMDFGIARAETNLFKTSTAAVTKGTPVYMSPEQVEGKSLDCRSDLFSLASVTAQMVTGEVAFQGTQLYHVLQKVAQAEVSDVMAAVTARSPRLAPVLERAFQRDPQDRYATAAEMGQALTEIYDTLPGDEHLGPWLGAWFPADGARADSGPAVGTAAPTEAPNIAEVDPPRNTTLATGPEPAFGATAAATGPMAVPPGVMPPPPPGVAQSGSAPSAPWPSTGPPIHPAAGSYPYTAPMPAHAPPRRRIGVWILVGSLLTLLLLCVAVIVTMVVADLVRSEPDPIQLVDRSGQEPASMPGASAPASGGGPQDGGMAEPPGDTAAIAGDALADAGDKDDREPARQDGREQPRYDKRHDVGTEPDEVDATERDERASEPGWRTGEDQPEYLGDDGLADADMGPTGGDEGIDAPNPGDGGASVKSGQPPSLRRKGIRPRPLLPAQGDFQGANIETDGDVPERVRRGLEAESTARRANAAEDLEDHRTSAASDAIEHMVQNESDATVRRQALEAGRKRRTAADVRIAVWAVRHDPDSGLRVHAARLLESYQDPASLRPLCRTLMEDSSASVRTAAAEAIEEFGDESCLPALRHQLEVETDSKVIEAIQDAIDEIE